MERRERTHTCLERSKSMMLFSIHSSIENAFTVFFAWLPRLAGALAVLVIGYLVAKLVAAAVPVIVMSIAVFMILEQLKIATQIVTITYAALWGAIALGTALAFGLGGRDVAARMLEGAYDAGQRNRGQFRRDLDQGMQRASVEADALKEKANQSNVGAATR